MLPSSSSSQPVLHRAELTTGRYASSSGWYVGGHICSRLPWELHHCDGSAVQSTAYEYCLLSLAFGNELAQHLQCSVGQPELLPAPQQQGACRGQDPVPTAPMPPGAAGPRAGTRLAPCGNVNHSYLSEVGGNMFLHDKE